MASLRIREWIRNFRPGARLTLDERKSAADERKLAAEPASDGTDNIDNDNDDDNNDETVGDAVTPVATSGHARCRTGVTLESESEGGSCKEAASL